MDLATFSRKLKGQSKTPRPSAVREFAEAVDGKPAGGMTPAEFARRAKGEPRRQPVGKVRRAKRFLEGEGGVDTPAEFRSKLGAARKAQKATTPAEHYGSAVRKAALAILDNDDLSWEERLKKIRAMLLAHAKLANDDAGDGKDEHLPEWHFREWSASDRRARKGAGLKGQGKGRLLLEAVCQPEIGVSVEPILRNVRVLGGDSKNKRRYTPDAMRQAMEMYEGAKVNVDHPAKPTEPRGIASRFGKLVNVRSDDDGLVADLVYNPRHPLAETIRYFAENMPELVGLSHNAIGEGRTDSDGVFVVTKIVKVRSVDLVADPATTVGLF